MRGSPTDLVAGFMGAIADELGAAVDDHLRSVDSAIGQDNGVLLLAAREIDRREGVGPPESVPVIDMLFERENLDAFEGLFQSKFCEKGIRGRTTGAAFRGEQFDDDGLLGGVDGVWQGGRMGGPTREEGQAGQGGNKKREHAKESSGAHDDLPLSIGAGRG